MGSLECMDTMQLEGTETKIESKALTALYVSSTFTAEKQVFLLAGKPASLQNSVKFTASKSLGGIWHGFEFSQAVLSLSVLVVCFTFGTVSLVARYLCDECRSQH